MELGDTRSVKETVKKQTLELRQQKEEIVCYKKETQKSIETAKIAVSKVKEQQKLNEPITKTEIDNLDLTIKTIEKIIKTSEDLLPKLDKQIIEFDKLDKFAQVIEDRIESKAEQLHDALELALLGLTAETLSHEIYNITDTLLLRSKDIKTRISKQDIPLLTYNEYVISTAIALRKQVSFLDPALKYVRDKKDNLELKSFLEEFISYQNERLKRDKIKVFLQSHISKLNIVINKGKLIQIFDNLINNSVYWLKREAGIDKRIYLELSDNAKVQIWDTGKGIDFSVEHNLFDPFVTAKYDKVNKVKGRGLGLYIIKQLLEYDNCAIELLPEKNEEDRSYKFQLDFIGVINE
jgi:signal transduction histidine kinase